MHDEPADNREKWRCKTCPTGANCEGVPRWSTMKNVPGFWSIPAEWTDDENQPYVECPFKEACATVNERTVNNTNQCTEGSIGPVCAVCDKDRFRSETGVCVPCSEAPAKTVRNVLPPLLLLIAMILLVFAKRKKIQELRRKYANLWRDIMRILTINISFAQVNGSLSLVVPVQWPQVYLDFMQIFQFVNFDLFGLFSVGCFDGVDYRSRVLFIILIPVVVVLLAAVIHVSCKRDSSNDHKPKVRTSAMLYLFDLVDSDKSGSITVEEFQILLKQMKHPTANSSDATALMKELGAKNENILGGLALILTREQILDALEKQHVNAVLGDEWVSITENRRTRSTHIATVLLLLFLLHAPVVSALFCFCVTFDRFFIQLMQD